MTYPTEEQLDGMDARPEFQNSSVAACPETMTEIDQAISEARAARKAKAAQPALEPDKPPTT